MGAAARVGDMHTCPVTSGPQPHVGGPIMPSGSTNVMIGGLPAARQTDNCTCAGPPDAIVMGSSTVKINGLSVARQNDSTSHGGTILTGFPSVQIGG